MFKRILVPVDGSEPSLCGLRKAIGLAATNQASLVIINVVSEAPLIVGMDGYVSYGEMAELMKKAGQEIVGKAAALAREAGVDCESHVVDGGVATASDIIVEQAAKHACDLIAMGTHGRRGLKRLTLGSDAELVVRHASVPVLLVKAPSAEVKA